MTDTDILAVLYIDKLTYGFMTIKELTADADSIRAQVIADADGDVDYIKTIAEHGCSGGSANNLIYYADTHAFTAKHMDEINEMIQDTYDESGYDVIKECDTKGDIFNFLAWWAYEVRAQGIMNELEPDL